MKQTHPTFIVRLRRSISRTDRHHIKPELPWRLQSQHRVCVGPERRAWISHEHRLQRYIRHWTLAHLH